MVAIIWDSEACVFTPPPDDLPLEFALDFHFKENPSYPALIYPTEDGLRSYTYQELVPAIHRAGQWISNAIDFRPLSRPCNAPVVIILLKTDTMTYLTVIAGLMRARVTAFPISPRFSPIVIAHLLKASSPKAIIYNTGTRLLANQALEEYSKECKDSPLLCELPSSSFLFPGHHTYNSLPNHERKEGDISVMIHSSSSSSLFPNVIPWSSGTILHHGEMKDFPIHQFAGKIIGSFELELFHSLGLCVYFTMVRRGLVLGIMDPSKQTSILPANINDVFRCFEMTQPTFLLTNPRAIELWAEDPAKVAALRNSSANVVYGGRFLSKTIGDELVKNGVKICVTYGSTESGPITLLPHFQGADWEYWTVYPRSDLNFIPRDDGLLELVVTVPKAERDYLPILNTQWDGKLGYNPGDLFIAHPTRPHTYKMFGRSSDQIMLSTGEMVNPVEIESELSKHVLVSSAVMFGHSRSSVGMVIEAKYVDHHNTRENTASEKDFLDEIWPSIMELNLKSPPFCNISRKMIILANTEKPISMSPKGLPRRPIVWQEYQDEIDAVYTEELKMLK